MIKTVTSTCPYIVVGNEGSGWIPTSGIIRFDSNKQCFEILNNSGTWEQIYQSTISISLSEQAKDAINWALAKMHKEQCLIDLAHKHPSVQDALNILEKTQHQLDVIVELVK